MGMHDQRHVIGIFIPTQSVSTVHTRMGGQSRVTGIIAPKPGTPGQCMCVTWKAQNDVWILISKSEMQMLMSGF